MFANNNSDQNLGKHLFLSICNGDDKLAEPFEASIFFKSELND